MTVLQTSRISVNYSADAVGNNYDSSATTTISGLTKGKSYHARVYAVTAAGLGNVGKSTTPRTAIDVPGLVIIEKVTSAVAGGVSLEVTWNGPSDTGDTTNTTYPILSLLFDFSTNSEFAQPVTVTLVPQVNKHRYQSQSVSYHACTTSCMHISYTWHSVLPCLYHTMHAYFLHMAWCATMLVPHHACIFLTHGVVCITGTAAIRCEERACV